MGYYSKNVFPQLTEFFLNNRRLNKERRTALAEARGRVLEVGFGSGLNLPFYPDGVKSLVALDPSKRAFTLAQGRVRQAAFAVEHLCATCESAALTPTSFDSVVTTWTLCTICNPLKALSKLCEVLKPDGRLLFLEHGRSWSRTTSRMQDLWNPIHRRVCAGCNVNRPIDSLIEKAGFQILSLDRFQLFGLGLFFSTYRGVAVPSVRASRSSRRSAT